MFGRAGRRRRLSRSCHPGLRLHGDISRWYVGGHGLKVRVLIVGDHMACLNWLPMDAAEKRALIKRLPLDRIDKTMATLAV